MKSKKRWFVTALTACLTLSLGICAEALEYDFDGVEDTEYYPSTSYESLYGAKYNYGGSNATDYQWQALPYGAISTMPEIPGLMLWKSGHAGVYIGGGYAIEAMGTSKGVVKTKVSDRNWQGWGKLPYIDYREGN